MDDDKAITRPDAGATLVEAALATVVFFMLVLAIIDLGRMHFTRSQLQYAVSQATRFAAVGRTLNDPVTGKAMSRQASIVTYVRQLSGIKDLADSDIVITSTNAAGTKTKGPGAGGDVVDVKATYGVRVLAPYFGALFPKGRFTFTCETTYRNEEF